MGQYRKYKKAIKISKPQYFSTVVVENFGKIVCIPFAGDARNYDGEFCTKVQHQIFESTTVSTCMLELYKDFLYKVMQITNCSLEVAVIAIANSDFVKVFKKDLVRIKRTEIDFYQN